MEKLLIFDTHPIQYRSPVFTKLVERHPGLRVFYFNTAFDGRSWWFHEVGKIPPQTWDLPLREGFPNEVLQLAPLSLRQRWRVLDEVFHAHKPSHVLIFGYYLPEHWMVRALAAIHGARLLFVGETFESGKWSLRRLLKTPLRSFFFCGVHRFISIGKKTETYYRALGISESRIENAKYCIDTSFFEQESEDARTRWRAQFEIPDDAFVVLFVGRLFERKRPSDVLEIHRALSSDPRVHTVIVGNGPLEKQLRAQGQPRLHWAGFQNQAQTRTAYHGADVLFVPSEYETWGLVVNEAAACGLPTVLTRTCGVADDLVVSGETGFVYDVGNLRQAEAYLGLLKDTPGLARKMGAAAREKVGREFTVDLFAQALCRAATPPPRRELIPEAAS